MLTFSLLSVFLNAFQNLDLNFSVIDTDAEELLFLLLETRLPLLGFTDVIGSLCLVLDSLKFLHIPVVFLLEIGGADVLGGLNVLVTTLQHLDVVNPHNGVLDFVAVAVGYLDGVPISLDVLCPLVRTAKVSEQFYLVGFHQCLGFGVGQQLLKECHGVDMVRGVLEPVSLDCISDLDAGVNPLVGYVIEGIVVVPYLQWRTESERVDVVAESPLQTYYGLVALWVNKILTDFKIGGLCLHSFAHFNYHQEHADYLIAFNGSDYVEIGLVADNSFFGVLDFYPCATLGT